MKKIFLMLALSTAFTFANAQSVFSKGDKVIDAGIGLGSTLYSGSYTNVLPTIFGSFETCIVDNLFNEKSSIGVGGTLAYTSAKLYGWRTSDILIAARGSFHYQFVNRLDTYATVEMGYDIRTWSSSSNDDRIVSRDNGNFRYSTAVGARYYFTDNFAVMSEFGYGLSAPLKLGVSIKF